MDFQFHLHDRLDLVRVGRAQCQHPQVIAKKLDRVMVLPEGREIGEQGTVVGILDMGFQRQVAFALGQLKNREQDSQQLFVVPFFVFRTSNHLSQRLYDAHNYGFRVGNNKRPEGAAENDHEFDRLPQNHQVAMNGIAPDDGADDD